jgi:hypothetical protein
MMNAADRAMAEALHALEAARPQSGYRPETEEEWNRLVAANEKMAYAMYLKMGHPKDKARALARMTNGGVVGRLMLELSLKVDGERHA